MKRLLTLATIFAITALFGFVFTDDASAQATAGKSGKGQFLHQYGPFDDDGDGIPNYQDPDHVKRLDGTGGARALNGKRGGFGPGDGSGNNGIGPRDGTGFGAGKGTGVCDGTGPKGSTQRRGR